MTKTISATEARKYFAQITNEVMYSHLEYHVVKHGKLGVKIIPATLKKNLDPNLKKHLQKFKNRYDYDLKKLAER